MLSSQNSTSIFRLSTVLLLISFSFQSYSQGFSIDNQFSDEETPIYKYEMSLEEHNEILIKSGFPPIPEDDPRVTPDKTIFMYYEGFKPEAGEDLPMEEIMLNPNETGHNFPLISKLFETKEEEVPPVLPVTTIAGLDFDDNDTYNGLYYNPADPSGAVGTTHVCHVVNAMISCHTKAGASATGFPDDLEDFFNSLTPANDTFDPKVLWDQYENRFVVVTLEKTATTSRVLLAVSDDANPEGTWYFQAIDVEQNIGGNDCWFDYPGFAIDDKAVYVTGNYFRLSDNVSCSASYVLIIDKGTTGGIYDGTVSADEDPASNSAFNIYNPVTQAGSGHDLTNQPAHTFGTPPTNMGTWLVGYSGLTNGTTEFIQFFEITNPLSTPPTFSREELAVANFDDTATGMADADQSGTTTDIQTNDRRALSAVWRNNKLWLTATVMPPSGTNNGHATAWVGQFSANGTAAISLDNQTEIGGEDIASGAATFFPSIVVDSNDDGYVGFSCSEGTIFCGSYAARVDGSTGAVGPTQTAQAGVDFFERDFGGGERWGDYSNIRLDPSDGSIWTANINAIAKGTAAGTGLGRWQTYMVKFATSEFLPVDLSRFDVYAEGNDAILEWTTESEINNEGFEIMMLSKGDWLDMKFVKGAGTSYESNDYKTKIEGLTPGIYTFKLRQKDFDGKTEDSQSKTLNIRTEDVYYLSNPQPNVFNESADFSLSVETAQEVRISLFDIYGRKLTEFYNGVFPEQETRTFTVESENLSEGYYFITVEGTYFRDTKKILFAK